MQKEQIVLRDTIVRAAIFGIFVVIWVATGHYTEFVWPIVALVFGLLIIRALAFRNKDATKKRKSN
ncbi:hypothetical protein [Nonomuraea sp. CA-141351]|uniref:hypothetical protein n=1 Tax=Nonomuraea sp. CA-141351 TaxID=3239996 RepID=UPI003D93936D